MGFSAYIWDIDDKFDGTLISVNWSEGVTEFKTFKELQKNVDIASFLMDRTIRYLNATARIDLSNLEIISHGDGAYVALSGMK